ncbi:MAG: hypothetical protein GY717_03970 [Rhodobacteraceae bacterium]|nr:hypothetical protein [Paracoccaceae bacterium]
MNRHIKGLAAAIALVVTTGTTTFAADTEHKFELAAEFYGQCNDVTNADFTKIREDVRAFTDMEVMAETLNDPKKFFRLMEVVNDPATIHVMMNCATEPVMWDTWMAGMFDIEKWAMASAKMMNPEGMYAWMLAPVDLDVWSSIIAHGDPNKYVRWGTAFITADFYKPVTNMVEVDWWGKRLDWMTTLDSYKPMLDITGLSYFTQS